MSRFNKSIRLDATDKRVFAAAQANPICAALFEAGGMHGLKPRKIGLIVQELTTALEAPMDDVCHALAKLSASGRFTQ